MMTVISISAQILQLSYSASFVNPDQYQLYLMHQATARRLNYAAEIRRKHRNEIIGGLRSKLLQSYQQIQIDWQTHTSQLPLSPSFEDRASQSSTFHQIYNILFSIVQQYNSSSESNQPNILHYILMCDDSQSFSIKSDLPNMPHQEVAISVADFKKGLALLPQLIKSLINQIDINFTRLKVAKNSQDWLQPLNKIQRCSDILNLNICFNSFLREYNHLVGQSQLIQGVKSQAINVGLIQLITDCLIESSCFKPRFFKDNPLSPEIRLIFNAVNQQMSHITKIMNTDICSSTLKCIDLFVVHQMPMVLFSNYIYIVGNVFICMNSHKAIGDRQAHVKMHNEVLVKFQRIIAEVVASKNQFNTDNHSKIVDFCSLVIWFLRNQILISLGMFDQERSSTRSTLELEQTVNTIWLNIVFGVFDIVKEINAKINLNASSSSHEAAIIIQALSLFHILFLDFSVTNQNAQRVLDQLINLRKMFEKSGNGGLISKIYEFFSVLSYTSSNLWIEKIYKQAQYALQNGLSNVGGLKFCAKMVEPDCRLPNQYKFQLLSHICGIIDASLQEAQISQSSESIESLLSLLFSAAKADQYYKMPFEKQVFNIQRVRIVLQLCSKVWEKDANQNSIVESLQLIRFLAYKDEFETMMNEIIKKAGYYEQLEILSESTDEGLNRLVYEIYEALDIQ